MCVGVRLHTHARAHMSVESVSTNTLLLAWCARTDLLTLQHYTGDKSGFNVDIDAGDQWGQTALHVSAP